MSEFKSIIDFISALLTPVVGIVASIILILQYKLANWRWKLDLYDKRYPVYTATQQFITDICNYNKNSDEVLFLFLREARDKEFLFGKEVQDFFIMLYKNGCDLEMHRSIFKDEPVGEKRTEHVVAAGELKKWFVTQYIPAKDIFSKYLKINKK